MLDNVSAHWPATTPLNPKHLHIIVELPPDRAVSPLLSETHTAETCYLWPVVTIEATAEGDFGGPAALERNQIFELHGTEPNFLKEFRTKLRQRRWIESDTNPVVLVLKDELHEFDNYFEDAPTDVGQRDRISGKDELMHLASTLFHKSLKGANVIKEENVWWDFACLGWYFHSVLGSRERHAFRADWPFKLIVSVESQRKTYRYTPRSDFHVSVDRLVSLMVEVQSDKNQRDRTRMLLQAACVARLGRLSYNPFIVVALYIENSGRMTRYFLFQRDDLIVRFPMSRTPKTGGNRPTCLLLYSKSTTWYRLYKVTDLSLETSRNASCYSVPTSRRISKIHSRRKGRSMTPAKAGPSQLSDPD
ncbi:hypothetical protein BJV78DRAFT_696849 [Lactifluus subvellereus]|nr:hypothetical protein BJV78DRAFT_696849 [Lactifluus subvellereus]